MYFFYLISRPVFAFPLINIASAYQNCNAEITAIDLIVIVVSATYVLVANVPAIGVPVAETFLANKFLAIFAFLLTKIVIWRQQLAERKIDVS